MAKVAEELKSIRRAPGVALAAEPKNKERITLERGMA